MQDKEVNMANKHKKKTQSQITLPTEEELRNLSTKKQTEHIYIALDSDVLRAFAWADSMIKQGKRITDDENAKNNYFLCNYANDIQTLLNLAHADKIRFFLPKTVYQESKYLTTIASHPLFHFIADLCYCPDVNSKKYKALDIKAGLLAQAYCETIHGEYSAMKAAYFEHSKSYNPTNDAYIMAQATIAGCACLLTDNRKDFIFNDKIDKHGSDRRDAIMKINTDYAYGKYLTGTDKFFVTKPVSISSLMNEIARHPDLKDFLTADDNNFSKACEIDLKLLR